MWREECLDLSAPRRFKRYDKLGCRLLLRGFKYYLFGSEDARLTKQRCEEFFSNQSNFVLPVGKPRASLRGPFAEPDQPNSWEALLAAKREKGRREAEEEGGLEGLFDFGSDLPTDRPADERCRHRLSQCWAPLSPTKCAKNAGHFPFTPIPGSWLNLIEGFFSKFARSVLRHIRVASKQELRKRIMAGIEDVNRHPVIHTWSYRLAEAA
jgi:hypothetical protein